LRCHIAFYRQVGEEFQHKAGCAIDRAETMMQFGEAT
jgi:hypothetical protein